MKTYQKIKQKHQKAYNKIIEDSGVFWAFSDDQFNEGLEKLKKNKQILPGEKLARVPGGGFVPSKNVDKMLKSLKDANKTKKAELKAAREAKESAILYELNNHECFYTGEYWTIADIFKGIYTLNDIKKVYNKHNN